MVPEARPPDSFGCFGWTHRLSNTGDMRTTNPPSAIAAGSAKQISWARNIQLSITQEASELQDKFLGAAIPAMLASISDSTVWIALSLHLHPGMSLTARIMRLKSKHVARLQTVIGLMSFGSARPCRSIKSVSSPVNGVGGELRTGFADPVMNQTG
jgi:hypothetical protein